MPIGFGTHIEKLNLIGAFINYNFMVQLTKTVLISGGFFMFVNFTNHPSAGWSSEQLDAAKKWGEVVDVFFPNVPPDFGEADISRLADDCISVITEHKPNAVLVQGEMTLAFAVAARLKKSGVPALCATTERKTEAFTDNDGATVTKSVFKFVRFREYLF